MNEENNNSSRAEQPGIQAAVARIMSNKVEAVLCLTRFGTVIFTILSLTSLFGVNTYSSYQRALLCNAATCAFRLHQRLQQVRFTAEFGALLIREDSCHYLLYSLLFIYSHPVPLALLPISLFAILYSSTYSAVIVTKLALQQYSIYSLLMTIIESQRQILWFVALSEICLFPFTVVLFISKGALLTPFAYYRFLTFRYASRRNAYTRTVFYELRVMLEWVSRSASCPQVLRNLFYKIITTVSWLAPPVPLQQQ